jgi:hypothetical protein
MARMIVEFEWKDDLGEHWMNPDNLGILLYTSGYVRKEHLSAKDITEQHQIDSRKSEILSKLMVTHDL